MKAIHQLVYSLGYGDAISNHAVYLRDWLRGRGYVSEIHAQYLDDRMAPVGRLFGTKRLNKQDGLIYHHSIGSELTPHAVRHPGPKLLIYHNITPEDFFKPYQPDLADRLRRGREELRDMAAHFPLSVGDSAYNARDLAEAGFTNPGVLPIVVDPSRWTEPPDPAWMDRLRDGRTNLLFVGRPVPNKCQHHLIEFFFRYLELDPGGRLLLVGSSHPGDPGSDAGNPYVQYLARLAHRFKIEKSVIFAGQLTEAELRACYQTAHLFVSMSEHEGFCVPLLEAMWFDVPVLAYKSSVIPETLGGAAFMFTRKDSWAEIAALARIITTDAELKNKILQAQRKRRKDFLPPAVQTAYEKMVSMMEAR